MRTTAWISAGIGFLMAWGFLAVAHDRQWIAGGIAIVCAVALTYVLSRLKAHDREAMRSREYHALRRRMIGVVDRGFQRADLLRAYDMGASADTLEIMAREVRKELL